MLIKQKLRFSQKMNETMFSETIIFISIRDILI